MTFAALTAIRGPSIAWKTRSYAKLIEFRSSEIKRRPALRFSTRGHSMFRIVTPFLVVALCTSRLFGQAPDLILNHGKIATVDKPFTIAEAIAVRGEQITAVGKNDEVLRTKGAETKLVDLGGKFAMPGLIDSHTHPTGAAMHEFDHPVPD